MHKKTVRLMMKHAWETYICQMFVGSNILESLKHLARKNYVKKIIAYTIHVEKSAQIQGPIGEYFT
jgi:hypothetical protein